jgi:putative hemolysin
MDRVLLFVLPKAQSGCMQANGAMSVIVHSMDGKYSVVSKMYSSIYSCRFCYAQTSFRSSFNWQGALYRSCKGMLLFHSTTLSPSLQCLLARLHV